MGKKDTHYQRRRRLRQRLQAQGVAPEVIERRIADLRRVQLGKRKADQRRVATDARLAERRALRNDPEQLRREEETYARMSLDDSKHRPAKADALRTGTGRVTGLTARAASRGKTYTKWQYDEAQERTG